MASTAHTTAIQPTVVEAATLPDGVEVGDVEIGEVAEEGDGVAAGGAGGDVAGASDRGVEAGGEAGGGPVGVTAGGGGTGATAGGVTGVTAGGVVGAGDGGFTGAGLGPCAEEVTASRANAAASTAKRTNAAAMSTAGDPADPSRDRAANTLEVLARVCSVKRRRGVAKGYIEGESESAKCEG